MIFFGPLALVILSFQYANSWPNWITQLVDDTDGSSSSSSTEESWTGRWFPDRPTESTEDVAMEGGGREMGKEDFCDDGKTDLNVDYNGNTFSYICMHPRNRLMPDASLPPLLETENIPPAYQARHRCMNESITYSSDVPTFGTHRQLWPIFGEYKYLPTQRWIHTLEHGGIVALYHPCADLRFVRTLKESVKSCLRRHVITPLETLDEKRPFVLVAWGARLRMPWVSRNAVRDFIQNHALRGPEKISREGQFSSMLIRKSEIVSDMDDSQLCPRPLAHDK